MGPATRPESGGATQQRVGLAAITALAFALRLYGIRFGLPLLSNFYVRPDESLIVVPAVDFFANGGNPGFFVYPAFMIALSAIVFEVYAHVTSWLASAPVNLQLDFGAEPSTYFLLVRLLSAVAGTAVTLIVYAIGRLLSGRTAGLLAALLYATAPLAVRDAHFGVTDTLLTLWSTAAVWQLCSYVDAPVDAKWRRLLCAGLSVGLAVSTKYSALVLVAVAIATVVVRHGGGIGRRGAAGGAIFVCSAAMFVVLNPYLIFDRAAPVGEVRALLAAIFQAHPASGPWQDVIAEIVEPLRQGPGLLLGLLLCGAGLAAPAVSRRQVEQRIILAAAAAAFLAPLLITDVRPYRYAVPALPLLSVLAAEGVFGVAALRASLRRPVAALLAAACVLPAAWRSIQLDVLLARDDTRTLAGRWIETHVPPEVPVVVIAPPECEPQVAESAASIQRRIDDVQRLYGTGAGERIAGLYRLQLQAVQRDGGREVFRNDSRVTAPQVCLVTASYPLPNPVCPPGWGTLLAETYGGTVAEAVSFDGVTPDTRGAAIDAIDAFFLPFTRLSHVVRPGPNVGVRILERPANAAASQPLAPVSPQLAPP